MSTHLSMRDGTRVSAAIRLTSLCEACIAEKTSVPAERVPVVLETISAATKLNSGMALCDRCLTAQLVFTLA
jgi:hypothetical protein